MRVLEPGLVPPSFNATKQLRTLSRKDAEFRAYLRGTFSRELRAIPVRSLNVNSTSEEITFEIVQASLIQRPSAPVVAWKLLRPHMLTFSVGPALVALAFLRAMGLAVDVPVALSSLLGIVLFHFAMNLFNDYADHVKGRDRVNPRGGSRAIQNGWVRAVTVQRLALAGMAAAAALGVPAFVAHPSLILVIVSLALIAAAEFSSSRLGLKDRGLGELVVFLLMGPLLTLGYVWAVAGEATRPMFALGILFGAHAVLYYHLSSLENIMADSQANLGTWAARLGFDRAKRFLWVLGALASGAVLWFGAELGAFGAVVPVWLLQGVGLFWVGRVVNQARSPLSSDLREVRLMGLQLQLGLVGLLLFLALFWAP